MAALTGNTVANTYKDLLQVSNSNSGIDATLRAVSDGEDTSSPLQLSSSDVAHTGLTASELVATGASKEFVSLAVATYPSLAELAYVKGVTSAIQTQMDAKVSTTLTDTNILVGNGSNVATGVAMSGDATLANTGAITIASDAVTYDKMQDTSGTDVILGRSTAGAGTIEEITCTSAGRALLDDANAAAQRTTLGLVPGTDVLANVVEDTTPQLGGQLDVNGNALGDGTNELLKFTETGSAVNEFTIVNAATGNAPALQATGDDTNIDIQLTPKGTGVVKGVSIPFTFALSDETTAIETGTAKLTWRTPYACTVNDVRGSLSTASSSGTPTFDINEGGVSILSTKLTIDANEKTSTTAATPVVISDSSLADDAEITFDIDTAGTGATGAKITMYLTRT